MGVKSCDPMCVHLLNGLYGRKLHSHERRCLYHEVQVYLTWHAFNVTTTSAAAEVARLQHRLRHRGNNGCKECRYTLLRMYLTLTCSGFRFRPSGRVPENVVPKVTISVSA